VYWSGLKWSFVPQKKVMDPRMVLLPIENLCAGLLGNQGMSLACLRTARIMAK